MPKGIPKAGFRRTGRRKSKTLQELEQELALKVPDIVAELEKLTKPFGCRHCGNEIRIIDKEVGMYLVDRVLGKPKQKHEVDITETIQLTADQVDTLLDRIIATRALDLVKRAIALLPRDEVVALLPQGEVVEGEYSEAAPENTGAGMK